MEDSEREILLDKVDRDSLTLGVSIPEYMEIQGSTVPMDEIAFNICSNGEIPDQFDLSLDGLKRVLRREMNDCIDQVESGDITYREGRDLVKKVSRIQRALNILENPEESDIEKKSKLSSAKDEKRWKEFVKKVKDG